MGAKLSELRGLSPADRAKRLEETRAELMHERGVAAMGGASRNPGKIRALRTTIARLLTIERETQGQGP
ncbi:MAG TPA: 50S ribosomal protein L29 [Candidatus Thermoplasmatota archaeon]|nr:50S ribosomal protein L29 [Candidatus Thermoplasmatota archaeon]